MTNHAAVRVKVQALVQDQREAHAFLRRHHWRMVGNTGSRWRNRGGDRRQLSFEVKWQAGAATPDGAGQGWRSRFRRRQ